MLLVVRARSVKSDASKNPRTAAMPGAKKGFLKSLNLWSCYLTCNANSLMPRSSISTATATKIKPIKRSTATTKRSPSTR